MYSINTRKDTAKALSGVFVNRGVVKMTLQIIDPIEKYLERSDYINFDNADVAEKAKQLGAAAENEIELIQNTYHFVRDEVKHSWDAQDRRITATASEVLREGVGICWAKANLLAALLRANGIPAGICYQRLTLGDTPENGYCIHALNAVYVSSAGKWIRLDARGNKKGVEAEMRLDGERLAFPVREEMGEADYAEVYSAPSEKLMTVLKNNTDAIEMYLNHLPDTL